MTFVNQFNDVTLPPQMYANKVRIAQEKAERKKNPDVFVVWNLPTQSVFPLELTMNHFSTLAGPSRGRLGAWNSPGGARLRQALRRNVAAVMWPDTSSGRPNVTKALSQYCME